MRKLDEFKGYTVDFRLHEFRKLIYGKHCEFVPFHSPKGRKLLGEYIIKGGSNELDMC